MVLVDDRIPCDANGNPAFCRHPDPAVYWAMIIEKAYAKFAGCYQALQGGTVVQGLEDLTGGIGYKFNLEKREKEWIPPTGETPERLWDEMMEKMKTEHVIGVANNTKGQPRPKSTKKGIELNRAYAVVTGGDFEDYKLLRLRIPLNEDGSAKEWNGKWSDNSGAWSTRMMQMLRFSRDSADGTFWMEYNDLCRHFNKVRTLHRPPPAHPPPPPSSAPSSATLQRTRLRSWRSSLPTPHSALDRSPPHIAPWLTRACACIRVRVRVAPSPSHACPLAPSLARSPPSRPTGASAAYYLAPSSPPFAPPSPHLASPRFASPRLAAPPQVYMCRMLDDLWTRFAVKSRWMDVTAGGCTNYISWRNNNQWLLTISRPNTKLIIKLTQPDARKSMGNGRHYSNAIGFYILKGNERNDAGDHKRRKLIARDGDEEDGGDFVFEKEPRYTRQVTAEYTFEEASTTPYVLVPYMFEPGREALFKLTLLSDDRDDDGIADFGFEDVKPEDDWKTTVFTDAWSKGGAGNQLGEAFTAGGPPSGVGGGGAATNSRGEPLWESNIQYQITVSEPTRCFVFLEMLNVKTDMRDVEGLQSEPAYPTVGFTVFKGHGNHIKLDHTMSLTKLHTAALKRGDGVCLELGVLESSADKYVVIPYTDQPNAEHKYNLTLYTDYEHYFERIVGRMHCDQCGNPSGIYRVLDSLDRSMRLSARVLNKERRLQIGDGGTYTGYVAPAPPKPKPYFPPQPPLPELDGGNLMVPPNVRERQPMRALGMSSMQRGAPGSELERKFLAADTDGDGFVTAAEAADFVRYHGRADEDGDGMISTEEMIRFIAPLQEQLTYDRTTHKQALEGMNVDISRQLEQIEQIRRELIELGVPLDDLKDKSRFCSVM